MERGRLQEPSRTTCWTVPSRRPSISSYTATCLTTTWPLSHAPSYPPAISTVRHTQIVKQVIWGIFWKYNNYSFMSNKYSLFPDEIYFQNLKTYSVFISPSVRHCRIISCTFQRQSVFCDSCVSVAQSTAVPSLWEWQSALIMSMVANISAALPTNTSLWMTGFWTLKEMQCRVVRQSLFNYSKNSFLSKIRFAYSSVYKFQVFLHVI